jgi:enoyl-CoA hydratase/carnithine racemase
MPEKIVPQFETLLYRVEDGVAWLTLNRPEVHNAFNATMQLELRSIWTRLRSDDDVRCVVLTGAGDRAFCTGVDRDEAVAGAPVDEAAYIGAVGTPFMYDEPGRNIGPKQCGLWKPVIAAVNGMACGGAFYLLGEVEFIIASEHATFFDPHVTYGMVAAYEPINMLAKMPFGEIMRLSLLGAHERMTAATAREVGLVSEVVPSGQLLDAARWAATTIASAPPVAIQGTLRSIWAARELARSQALELGYAFIGLGNDPATIAAGQEAFTSGRRIEPRLR